MADGRGNRVPTPWGRFADVVLQRAALMLRVDRNCAPDPLAGLKVDDADVEVLLGELPGLERAGDGDAAAELDASLADQVDEALAALVASRGGGEFAAVARRAGLSEPELAAFALLAAVEVDPRRQRLVGYLNDDVGQRRLNPWTLSVLLGPVGASVTGPGGNLALAGLLSRPPDDWPWASTPVRLAPPVVWWLVGDRSPDPDLAPGATVVAGQGSGAPGAAAALIVVAGPDRLRRLQAASGGLGGGPCLVTDLPTSDAQWEATVRHATLAGLGVVVEVTDDLPTAGRDRIERAPHLGWAVSSAVDLPVPSLPRRPWRQPEVAAPVATATEWAAAFPGTGNPGYPLTADQLHQVAIAAPGLGGDLTAAVRRLAAGHIDASATRIRPSRGWDDLVLDHARLTQVREVSLRSRHRATVFEDWGFSAEPSAGVVALFAGASGTGKTLAAEIIAGDLGVDLYKIDLANLTSKYIGETEKNLARVFDAAEASRVVLFFDEADALLGKRSEVSDAHDRYANIEVAYLLQRLERYEGVAVMATNLANNIDAAFLRRLHVVVEFPMPGPEERRRIWARCLPASAPLDADLDVGRLGAAVEVAGGTIRNAALSAAFLAAEAGGPITMAHAAAALRAELRKMGRLVDDLGL